MSERTQEDGQPVAGTPGPASQQTDFGSVLLEGDRAEVHGLRSGKYNGKLVVLGKYVPGESAPRFEVPELGVRVRPGNLRSMFYVEKRHSLSFGMAGPRPSMVGGGSGALGAARSWGRRPRACVSARWRSVTRATTCPATPATPCSAGRASSCASSARPRPSWCARCPARTRRCWRRHALSSPRLRGRGRVSSAYASPLPAAAASFPTVARSCCQSRPEPEWGSKALLRCLHHMHTCSIAIRTDVSPFCVALPAGRELSVTLFVGATAEHVEAVYAPLPPPPPPTPWPRRCPSTARSTTHRCAPPSPALRPCT